MADDTRSNQQRREEPEQPATGAERELARGRRSEMPFVLVGGTALVVWAIAALIAAVALVVWWVG
jgi:hypothetical protein